tara:strand:+ start:174 stop:737 length:564 start_codon:yes stop_codon:yes gene_type:complete
MVSVLRTIEEENHVRLILLLSLICVGVHGYAIAQQSNFSTGPVIQDFGPVAPVSDVRLDAETELKVAFDVAEPAKAGQINRRLESAARFLNMHGDSGVPVEQMSVAIVVHGPAAMDLVTSERYGSDNANSELIAALIEAGVSIELCGQTAAFREISEADLLPGVKLSLSAMTSHALLQQSGYTLNPF